GYPPSSPSVQCLPPLSANPSTGLHSVSATPLCQSLHWPPFSATPLCQSLHSVSARPPLCQSLHWPIQCLPPLSANPSLHSVWPSLHSFSVCHPSLPVPMASIQWPPLSAIQPPCQCLPPLSANPSTGLHSVSATPLCQSLHWPPFSVCHPS
ncbi:unnamed protein product, partial [Staurois parvus]